MSSASDKSLIIRTLIQCLDRIEEKQKWGRRNNWTNFHYNQLSDEIYAKTGHLVSYNTLKRIFGKVSTSDSYVPRTSTLDILAVFLEYKDWKDFSASIQKQEDKKVDRKPVKAGNFTNRRLAYFVTLFAGIISVSFLTMLSLQSKDIYKQPVPFEVMVDSAENKKGHFVNFSSATNRNQLEGFGFHFGDDTEVLLDSLYENGQYEFSHIYRLPGYYKAQIKKNGKTVQVVPVHIKTDGWNGALSLDDKTFNVLQRDDFTAESGKLQVNAALLKSKLSFRQLAWGYSTRFYNYFDSEINGRFILEAKIGFEQLPKSMFCEKVKVIISGSESDIAATFTQRECISEALIEVKGYMLKGQETNLSAMGLDLYQLHKITISASDNSVDIIAGDELLYRLPYQQSMGEIKGIAFEFLGNGYLKGVKLTDKSGEKKLATADEII